MDQARPCLGLPHGLSCALALPATVEFLGPQPAYSRVSLALGGRGSDADLWRHLLRELRRLTRQLGLPGGYRQCGVSEQAYAALLPELIPEALAFRGEPS
jgi:alcohol dehydrogenase class IV